MTKLFAAIALVLATASPSLAMPFADQSPWFQAKEDIRVLEQSVGSDSN